MLTHKVFPTPGVLPLVILQTAVALVLVVPATWVVTSYAYDYLHLAQSNDPHGVVRFVTLLSGAETLVFCPLLFAPVATLLRRRADAQARLERLADTDALTGLLNRRGLEKASDRLIACAAERGETVAALVCDIDHFKSVNDLYGHSLGDETLRVLGAVLAERFGGERAAVGRIGGEEFLALMIAPNPRAAHFAAESLRRAFAEREITLGAVRARCTLSVGAAAAAAPCALSPLVDRADAALYRAKAAGRNRVAFADAAPALNAA